MPLQSLSDNRALYASGINSAGHVAGQGVPYAFTWSADGGMKKLAAFSTTKNVAYAINDSDLAVGWSYFNGKRAALWAVDGSITAIPGLTGDSVACDINNTGHVVGNDSLGTFVWGTASGTIHLANIDNAVAINDQGHIVAHNSSGYILWRAIDDITVLNTSPDWQSFLVTDLNGLDQIVGYALVNGTQHAILWNTDGAIVDFGVGRAAAINDSGQALTSSAIWTPVPKPSSLLALAGGFAGFAGIALRRRGA